MSEHIHQSKRVRHKVNLFRLSVLFAQREIVTPAFSDVDCEVARVCQLILQTWGLALCDYIMHEKVLGNGKF